MSDKRHTETPPMDTAHGARSAYIALALRGAFWVLLLAVAVMSLLPGEKLPAFSATIWDKAQHAGGYAALATLGLWAYGGRVATVRLMLALMAFGVGIEFAQSATGWRQGDVRDALANTAGLAVGWLVWRLGVAAHGMR